MPVGWVLYQLSKSTMIMIMALLLMPVCLHHLCRQDPNTVRLEKRSSILDLDHQNPIDLVQNNYH
jgi:hypothetical protein